MLKFIQNSSENIPERFERLITRSRLVLLWESSWPRLLYPLGAISLFVGTTSLGVFDLLPHRVRAGLFLGFVGIFLCSLVPLSRVRIPTRRDGLRRIDSDSRLGYSPAGALSDTLAVGASDQGSLLLWELHKRRARENIDKLKVDAPRPGASRHDRYALRFAVLLFAAFGFFVAGPDYTARFERAFDWREPPPPPIDYRIDAWIDPPIYTGRAPLVLDTKSPALHVVVPVRSVLLARVSGEVESTFAASPLLIETWSKKSNDTDSFRERSWVVEGDANLEIAIGQDAFALAVETIPDMPPEIRFEGPIEGDGKGGMQIPYRTRDDYGVVRVEAIFARAEGIGTRTLYPAPEITLPLPRTPKDGAVLADIDLSDHPWAGARVQMSLRAHDAADQEGWSAPAILALPKKRFEDPLARALAEQRQNLVFDPDRTQRVQAALDALLIAPEIFMPNTGAFLALHIAANRLREARTDDDLIAVAEWLWALAMDLESGQADDPSRALQEVQERLQDALEDDVSSEEMDRLAQELRDRLDDLLRDLAQRPAGEDDEDSGSQSAPQRTITREELEQLAQDIQNALRSGDTRMARELMAELQSITRNLRAARRGSETNDQHQNNRDREISELENLMSEQERLQTETFREGRAHTPQGPSNEEEDTSGTSEDARRSDDDEASTRSDDSASTTKIDELRRRQEAIRERIENLRRQLGDIGSDTRDRLMGAEQAIRDAEDALRDENGPDDAVEAQNRALQSMRDGLESLSAEARENFGRGRERLDEPEESRNESEMSRNGGRDGDLTGQRLDPLGRTTARPDMESGTDIRAGGESAAVRAREITEQLREKLADPNRPREERDYFERLLKR